MGYHQIKARQDSGVVFCLDDNTSNPRECDHTEDKAIPFHFSVHPLRLSISPENIDTVRKWIGRQPEDVISRYREVEICQWQEWHPLHDQDAEVETLLYGSSHAKCLASIVIDLDTPCDAVSFTPGQYCRTCQEGNTKALEEVEFVLEDCYFWAGARRKLIEVLDAISRRE